MYEVCTHVQTPTKWVWFCFSTRSFLFFWVNKPELLFCIWCMKFWLVIWLCMICKCDMVVLCFEVPFEFMVLGTVFAKVCMQWSAWTWITYYYFKEFI